MQTSIRLIQISFLFPSFKNKEFFSIYMDLGLHWKVDISLRREVATFPCITIYLQIFKLLTSHTQQHISCLKLLKEKNVLSSAHKGLTSPIGIPLAPTLHCFSSR